MFVKSVKIAMLWFTVHFVAWFPEYYFKLFTTVPDPDTWASNAIFFFCNYIDCHGANYHIWQQAPGSSLWQSLLLFTNYWGVQKCEFFFYIFSYFITHHARNCNSLLSYSILRLIFFQIYTALKESILVIF